MDGLENFPGHIEGKHGVSSLMSLCEWMAERGERWIWSNVALNNTQQVGVESDGRLSSGKHKRRHRTNVCFAFAFTQPTFCNRRYG